MPSLAALVLAAAALACGAAASPPSHTAQLGDLLPHGPPPTLNVSVTADGGFSVRVDGALWLNSKDVRKAATSAVQLKHTQASVASMLRLPPL